MTRAAPKPVSPFAKFRQLEKQNTINSPKHGAHLQLTTHRLTDARSWRLLDNSPFFTTDRLPKPLYNLDIYDRDRMWAMCPRVPGAGAWPTGLAGGGARTNLSPACSAPASPQSPGSPSQP
ncbi:hypothetical protein RR46_11518 [Papilio xuthus]|uniref:Uncharacterized protein n=1 Tax=Papilio xuthus TaxID=66420 RepID=A0A194PXD4_PAPXU|nr:hypothetical protein RR46_11518 [Papilio xuthus]